MTRHVLDLSEVVISSPLLAPKKSVGERKVGSTISISHLLFTLTTINSQWTPSDDIQTCLSA
jgi:hypothetical protein